MYQVKYLLKLPNKFGKITGLFDHFEGIMENKELTERLDTCRNRGSDKCPNLAKMKTALAKNSKPAEESTMNLNDYLKDAENCIGCNNYIN